MRMIMTIHEYYVQTVFTGSIQLIKYVTRILAISISHSAH